MGAIMSDIYPEANKIANEVIPGVYGSFRGYWIKGFVGMKVKVVRTSEAERFYKMGKEEQKKRRAKMIMRPLTEDDKIHIVTMLINDPELHRGGIPAAEKYLKEKYGFTEKQVANITFKLYKLVKSIK